MNEGRPTQYPTPETAMLRVWEREKELMKKLSVLVAWRKVDEAIALLRQLKE